MIYGIKKDKTLRTLLKDGWENIELSADGNIVVCGSRHASGTYSYEGKVRVFEYNGSSGFKKDKPFMDKMTLRLEGLFLAISSDGLIFATGAKGDNTGGGSAGQVRVFQYDGSSWALLGQEIREEGQTLSPVSLSANGLRMAVGAYYNYSTGAGIARVYDLINNSWTQVALQ